MLISTLRGAGLCFLLAGGLLAVPARAQNWQSVITPAAGSTGTLTILATALDASGNLAVAGAFTGTVNLGTTTLVSAGGLDMFVARLSPSGTWLQAGRSGGPDADQATAVTVAANGDIIVAGHFASAQMTLGPLTINNSTPGTTDVFVARLGQTITQAQVAGGPFDDYSTGIGLDATGTVTVVGSFRSATFVAGTSTLTNVATAANLGTTDLFAARWNGTAWTHAVSAGGQYDDLAEAVAITPGGDAVVAGSFSSSSASFGSTTLNNTTPMEQEYDAFVARLSPAGSWTQAVAFGGAGGEYLHAVGVDSNGNAVVAGEFSGATMVAGPMTLTNVDPSGNTSDVVVARLSAAGIWNQAVRSGSSDMDYALGLSADASGNAIVAGHFYGSAFSAGPFTLPNTNTGASSSEAFVLRLNTAGTWTRALAAGGTGNDYATTVAADAVGNAYVSGMVASQGAQFGSVAVVGGAATGFVARISGLPLSAAVAAGVERLEVFPNPAAGGAVTVSYYSTRPESLKLAVLDALGREVVTVASGEQLAGARSAVLQVGALASGVYVVRAQVGERVSFRRLVVE